MNTDSPTAPHRTTWRKSTYSTGTGSCVEVAPTTDGVAIRHSKHPTAGTITFPHHAWTAFLSDAPQNGRTNTNGIATITKTGTDTLVKSLTTTVELRFDAGEWTAFLAGATDSEFDLTGKLTAAS
jgi:hypothetical protein